MNLTFNAPPGGYGRIWEHMYEGSLAGAGPEVFCVWPYVIAKMRNSPGVGAVVMLNPDVLAPIFGVVDSEGRFDRGFVQRAIDKLCAPDPASKNGRDEGGSRLKHISGYLYLVVNGAEYMAIRAKDRHADAQARYRDKHKKKHRKSAGQVRAENDERESRYLRAETQEESDRIVAEGLPEANGELR